jgi:hypothetical protein
MQAPKKTTNIKEALRAKTGIAIEPQRAIAVNKALSMKAVNRSRPGERMSPRCELRPPNCMVYPRTGCPPSRPLRASSGFSALDSDDDFHYLHVEALLDQAASLLEHCASARSQRDLIQIEKWKLQLELDQFFRLDQVHELERHAGLTSAPSSKAAPKRVLEENRQECGSPTEGTARRPVGVELQQAHGGAGVDRMAVQLSIEGQRVGRRRGFLHVRRRQARDGQHRVFIPQNRARNARQRRADPIGWPLRLENLLTRRARLESVNDISTKLEQAANQTLDVEPDVLWPLVDEFVKAFAISAVESSGRFFVAGQIPCHRRKKPPGSLDAQARPLLPGLRLPRLVNQPAKRSRSPARLLLEPLPVPW